MWRDSEGPLFIFLFFYFIFIFSIGEDRPGNAFDLFIFDLLYAFDVVLNSKRVRASILCVSV